MISVPVDHLNLWFKVFHPEFDPNLVYKAISFDVFGETAWSQILFLNERGMMYSVINYKCRCTAPNEFSRAASDYEKELGPAIPKGRNPDIESLDK